MPTPAHGVAAVVLVAAARVAVGQAHVIGVLAFGHVDHRLARAPPAYSN